MNWVKGACRRGGPSFTSSSPYPNISSTSTNLYREIPHSMELIHAETTTFFKGSIHIMTSG